MLPQLDTGPQRAKIEGMRSTRIRRLAETLSTRLPEKEETLRLTLLAALAGENVFLYGPPGVAKSMLARRVSWAFQDARSFEYLLGRFTTPEEIFGPVSISRLKNDDRFERVTDGFLPSAEIVFLDEIWNASSPILNSLLTAISERRFRNGGEEMALPLQTVIGAAGSLVPDQPGLEALWDRFLLRLRVDPVQSDEAFMELIASTEDLERDPVEPSDKITADELDEWSDVRDAIEIPDDVMTLILDLRERIRRHNSQSDGATGPITVSDRRWRQAVRLLRTSALLNDRASVDALDCALMQHCLWSNEADVPVIRTIIEEALRRYSSSGRFDPEDVRQRLEAIRNRIMATAFDFSEESVAEPVEYRGEYYRIEDLSDEHMALIWMTDFQQLVPDQPIETDIFFYADDDDYAYSERLLLRAISASELEVDGQLRPLETRSVTRSVARRRPLEASVRDGFLKQLGDLRDELADIQAGIAAYRARTSDEAVQHLFVHRSYADLLYGGIEAAAAEFAALEADLAAEERKLRDPDAD